MVASEGSFAVAPADFATCMYYTGIDPFSKKTVPIACNLED